MIHFDQRTRSSPSAWCSINSLHQLTAASCNLCCMHPESEVKFIIQSQQNTLHNEHNNNNTDFYLHAIIDMNLSYSKSLFLPCTKKLDCTLRHDRTRHAMSCRVHLSTYDMSVWIGPHSIGNVRPVAAGYRFSRCRLKNRDTLLQNPNRSQVWMASFNKGTLINVRLANLGYRISCQRHLTNVTSNFRLEVNE